MPWDRYHNRPTPPPPARQRKIDAIRPLVEARGYRFHELIPSKGYWRVSLLYTPESIDVQSDYRYDWGKPLVGNQLGVERDDFDILVALFRDDRRWAAYIHHLFGGAIRNKLQIAAQGYREYTKKYGDQSAHLLRAHLEGKEGETARIREAITSLETLATTAANEIAALEARLAMYNATVPQDDEGAAAYLARCPRLKDRPAEKTA